MTHLRIAGERALGTTRQSNAVSEDRIYLDLSKEDVADWRCPWPVKVAVICASVTNLNDCKLDPIGSACVNIHGVSALANNLAAGGAFIIYLSTNQVFDGTVPYRRIKDPLSPITEYGRQKAVAELSIGALGDSAAIIRLTKVLGPRHALFSSWAEALRRREPIQPFSDMVIAPIPLSCVVSVLRLLIDRRLPGIFHVSGERDISYEEAALLGSKLLGADPKLIHPVTASQAKHSEAVAAHTTLNIDNLRLTLGIEPPNVQWTIEKAFLQPQALEGTL